MQCLLKCAYSVLRCCQVSVHTVEWKIQRKPKDPLLPFILDGNDQNKRNIILTTWCKLDAICKGI